VEGTGLSASWLEAWNSCQKVCVILVEIFIILPASITMVWTSARLVKGLALGIVADGEVANKVLLTYTEYAGAGGAVVCWPGGCRFTSPLFGARFVLKSDFAIFGLV